MKIRDIRIVNFRSFKDETVHFDRYTSLIGANGAGKSTVLCALNLFFRETEGASTNLSELDKEDFHNGDTATPIEITVTFDDLGPEAQEEFKEYFRAGVLVVTARAVFNAGTGTASVKQFGQRAVFPPFTDFFKKLGDKAAGAELKTAYALILAAVPGLPAWTSKDAAVAALREYEEGKPELCELWPSEDQFYGFSKGGNRLDKFVQWVYVPAVKDASKENVESKFTALGRLLARTVRSKVKFDIDLKALRDDAMEKYGALLEAQQGTLTALSESLTKRLGHWAHPNTTARLTWAADGRSAVKVEEPAARLIAGEGEFEGELARFGHGLQRSYLLALLQELASDGEQENGPTLILGCEEPELYQHPPQARHLASVLQKLAESNSQIIVSTHSPCFISGRTFESIRLARRDGPNSRSSIRQAKLANVAAAYAKAMGAAEAPVPAAMAMLHQALQPQLNEMFFATHVTLVEGAEDVAYIHAWMILTDRWEDYRRSGSHVVAVNGKSELIRPIAVAQELQLPVLVVFDADGHNMNVTARPKHERDNIALLRLLGGDEGKPFPDATVWGEKFVQWPQTIGHLLKAEVGDQWEPAFSLATKGLGGPDGSFQKNTVHIGDHLSILREQKANIPTLDKLCDVIIASGKAA